MSRYIERAENTIRLVDVTHQTILESEHSNEELDFKHWIPTLETLGDLELYKDHYKKRSSRTVTEFLIFDPSNSSSVFSSISSARENARMIRDQISTEMWEALNKLYLFIKRADSGKVCSELDFSFFAQIKDFSHLFRGIIESTFPHDLGYDYVVCGREIERAIKTCQILGTKKYMPSMADSPDDALDAAQYAAILRSTTGFEAFHHEHGSDLDRLPVQKFLLLSRIFPRSALYCIQRLQNAMHAISGCPTTYYSNEAERLTGRLVANLNYAVDADLRGEKGDTMIHDIQVNLEEIATAFSLQYMGVKIYDPAA
jgi:uncharacterized alpha-E superfamily protein